MNLNLLKFLIQSSRLIDILKAYCLFCQKKINCDFISAYESEWALDERRQRTFDHLENYPIIARRDKKRNIFSRFIDRQKKNYRRRVTKLKKFL